MSDFRPRSGSEILDAAFEIYRRHFTVFIAISVFAAIPWAIASYVSETAVLSQQPAELASSLLITLLGFVVAPFTEGAMTAAASAAYLGSSVDFGRSFRAAFARPGRLFFAMCVKWIAMAFGLLLFLVPGFIVFKRYFALPMTVVLEDNTVGDAISRSRALSNGNGSRIFALIGGVFLFTTLVSWSLGRTFTSPILIASLRLFLGTVISPFSTIVATILYYDIRIRKEGYDIELMTQALNAASPLQPVP